MGQFDAVLSNPATRRTFLKGVGVLGGMGVLAACRRQDTSSAVASGAARPAIEATSPVCSIPTSGQASRRSRSGRTTSAEGYADPKFTFFTNTEQALAKTAAGTTWDTVHPEIGYIQDYINLDAIQPWDTSLISNFGDLNPVLEQAGNINGQQYEIVTDWGYSGVIIRTDHVDPSINSYSYLFDDDLAGHISWFDSPWVLQQAAMVQGVPGEDTFDMPADQLEAAKNLCIEKKKNLYNIWVDFTQMWDDVIKGNVWAAYAWPDAWLNTKDDAPTQYIRPKEGVLSWGEGLLLAKNTENYYHAHKFVDAWTTPRPACGSSTPTRTVTRTSRWICRRCRRMS